MPLLPTIDPVALEQTLAAQIRDILNSVPVILAYCKVHLYERYPETDAEDVLVSTVPDFDQDEIAYTSIIQIGLPTVAEKAYTSEKQTQLTFIYPITFDAGVRDKWSDQAPYPNSRAFVMAVYMLARKEFKEDVTLGFDNCQHTYLQLESAATVEDEETAGRLHTMDWSLTVHVKGVDT